jgi:hypothetical protein
MVRREDYLYRTLIPKRIEWCDVYAKLRQDDAVKVGRKAGHGAPEDPIEALFLNRIGLYAEAANMLHLSPVKIWNYYKKVDKGGLHRLADFEDWIDSKCNKQQYNTNYLIISEDDPPDWAYIMTYPMPGTKLMTWCSVGWCFGWAAQKGGRQSPLFYALNPRRPPAFNVPHTSPLLLPMRELIVLHQLRLEFGNVEGQERWLKMRPRERIEMSDVEQVSPRVGSDRAPAPGTSDSRGRALLF